MNEHEIRDREILCVLELLQISRRLTNAHSKIVMRHFSEARELLLDIMKRISSVLDLVPEEEGE